MRDIDRLLEDGGIDLRMRCPSCFAFGKEGPPHKQPGSDNVFENQPPSPDPECAYCSGKGFVEVVVTTAPRPLVETLEAPLFEVPA